MVMAREVPWQPRTETRRSLNSPAAERRLQVHRPLKANPEQRKPDFLLTTRRISELYQPISAGSDSGFTLFNVVTALTPSDWGTMAALCYWVDCAALQRPSRLPDLPDSYPRTVSQSFLTDTRLFTAWPKAPPSFFHQASDHLMN